MEPSRTSHSRSVVIVALLACFVASFARASGSPVHFEIEAGDAFQALHEYKKQSKVRTQFFSEDVSGVVTNSIHGDYDVSDAMALLLKGTPLQAVFKDNDTFVSIIRRTEPKLVEPEPAATAPDADFLEVVRVFGRAPELSEVVVTGTLMRGVQDVMSPLEFVTKRDMKNTPYATVYDALQALPQSFGGGRSEDFAGMGNFGRGSALNLRGLGGGATLALVDGRRQPFSGTEGDFVDLSNFPSLAVERIEVLADGASALYGSDAIAGVVNVIMRKRIDNPETFVRYGSAQGGGDELFAASNVGTDWRGGNAALFYQYQHRTALPASARSYAANADKRPLGGNDYRTTMTNPGNILDPVTMLPSLGIPHAADDGRPLTLADLTYGEINKQNQWELAQLLPEKKMHSVLLNASQRLGRFELFADARLSIRDMTQNMEAAQQVLQVPSSNPFVLTPYPNTPFVLIGYNFQSDLGPLVGSSRASTLEVGTEITGPLGGNWQLRLTSSYGSERTHYTVQNLPDRAELQSALADPNPATAFDPVGSAGQSSEVLQAIRGTQVVRARSTLMTLGMVADGTLFSVPTGDVKLALGSDIRREIFEVGTTQERHFSRSVASAFAELAIPLVGDARDVRRTPRLELSIAGRAERYGDLGTASNPKIGLRWMPMDSLKLRTSWGTSFRAPKLTDLYDNSQNLAVLAVLPDPRADTGASLVIALQGANPDAEPETASTWSAGLDLSLFNHQTALSLTYFTIDYQNRIVVPGPASPFDIFRHETQWQRVILRDPPRRVIEMLCTSDEFLGSQSQCLGSSVTAIVDYRVRNLARTRVKGMDLTLDHSQPSAWGKFEFGINGTYLFAFEQALSGVEPATDLSDTVGNPLALRLRGTADWWQRDGDRPGFGASMALNYWGRYEDRQAGFSRPVSPLTTVDLRLSYRTDRSYDFLGSIELALGASNLFDASPPFVDGEFGYDPMNATPYGRVVSLSVLKNW